MRCVFDSPNFPAPKTKLISARSIPDQSQTFLQIEIAVSGSSWSSICFDQQVGIVAVFPSRCSRLIRHPLFHGLPDVGQNIKIAGLLNDSDSRLSLDLGQTPAVVDVYHRFASRQHLSAWMTQDRKHSFSWSSRATCACLRQYVQE